MQRQRQVATLYTISIKNQSISYYPQAVLKEYGFTLQIIQSLAINIHPYLSVLMTITLIFYLKKRTLKNLSIWVHWIKIIEILEQKCHCHRPKELSMNTSIGSQRRGPKIHINILLLTTTPHHL